MRNKETTDGRAREVLERLCGRDLSSEEVAEATFNLVQFSQTLLQIAMDKGKEERQWKFQPTP